MIKNRCIHLFVMFLLSNQSLFPSDNHEKKSESVFTFQDDRPLPTQKTVAQLANELKPFNSITIQDYEWTVAQDHDYTPPIKHLTLALALSQLREHSDNKKPLASIVSEEDALSIKEGFLNVLYNSRCSADEEVKRGYDITNGPGKFFETYGNYKKSREFNPAHNYACKVWPHLNHNRITITELTTMSEDSIEETGAAWLVVKKKIEEDTCKRLLKPVNK